MTQRLGIKRVPVCGMRFVARRFRKAQAGWLAVDRYASEADSLGVNSVAPSSRNLFLQLVAQRIRASVSLIVSDELPSRSSFVRRCGCVRHNGLG